MFWSIHTILFPLNAQDGTLNSNMMPLHSILVGDKRRAAKQYSMYKSYSEWKYSKLWQCLVATQAVSLKDNIGTVCTQKPDVMLQAAAF